MLLFLFSWSSGVHFYDSVLCKCFFHLKESLRIWSSVGQVLNLTLEDIAAVSPIHLPMLCVTIGMLTLAQSYYVLYLCLLVQETAACNCWVSPMHARAQWEHGVHLLSLCPSEKRKISYRKFLYFQGASGKSKSEFVNKWKMSVYIRLELFVVQTPGYTFVQCTFLSGALYVRVVSILQFNCL